MRGGVATSAERGTVVPADPDRTDQGAPVTAVTAAIYPYKGFTITKAVLFDGVEHRHAGWDVTRVGTDVYQGFDTVRAAKVWVDARG